jgi:hypothetical protein
MCAFHSEIAELDPQMKRVKSSGFMAAQGEEETLVPIQQPVRLYICSRFVSQSIQCWLA